MNVATCSRSREGLTGGRCENGNELSDLITDKENLD